jgi:hypothetical protein
MYLTFLRSSALHVAAPMNIISVKLSWYNNCCDHLVLFLVWSCICDWCIPWWWTMSLCCLCVIISHSNTKTKHGDNGSAPRDTPVTNMGSQWAQQLVHHRSSNTWWWSYRLKRGVENLLKKISFKMVLQVRQSISETGKMYVVISTDAGVRKQCTRRSGYTTTLTYSWTFVVVQSYISQVQMISSPYLMTN